MVLRFYNCPMPEVVAPGFEAESLRPHLRAGGQTRLDELETHLGGWQLVHALGWLALEGEAAIVPTGEHINIRLVEDDAGG